MSNVFRNIVIRAALYPDDVRDGNNFVTVTTAQPPAMYIGAQVELQFCLFKSKANGPDQPAVLNDLSEFTGLPKMRVRTTNAAGAILLDESLATAVEKDSDCSLEEWNAGTSQHFRFYFPETNTVITAGAQYIVIYGPDGDVFGRSQITVIDAGTASGASPTPSASGYYTKPEMQGILGDYLPKTFGEGQPLVFLARNPVTGQLARITQTPIWDEQGPRLVTGYEDIT